MHRKCQEHSSSLNVDLQSQLDSVPIELMQLINFLQDGIDLHDKGYSKEALAISQTIMCHFRYNIKNKGISSYKRRNKNTQPPFLLYVAVKLYSSNRSKTLVNWLYFCDGISLLNKSLLELTRDIANRMIAQHDRDGAFLPRTLRKGILTIIAKDNIDQTSKSATATRHYHGTSLSIFQFPTEENPARAVAYGDLENSSNQSCLKIDALPSSYIYVKNFLTPLQTLTMPSKLPPTPFPTTPESNYRNRISDEVEWLKTAYTTNIWTAWARYQSQRSHHTRKPDIQAVLPLINAPVHRLDTQYHCMEIAEKTQLMIPAQICVDESDQPVYKLSKELQ